MRLEVEDLTDQQIAETEMELFQDQVDADHILQQWFAGRYSDVELIELLKKTKREAMDFAPTFILDRMRRGA